MSLTKKSIFLVTSLIVFIVLVICYLFIIPSNGNVIIESGKSNQFVSTNSLTMMYETGPDTGEYQVSSDTSWPQEGYTFNETLSKCENDSVLTWDDENKKILLQTNTSDKCYVFFDKSLPRILDVSFATNQMCSGNTGLVEVVFDGNYNVSEYFISYNDLPYQQIPLEDLNNDIYNGCGGSLCWTYNATYNYKIYAFFEDGTMSETFESSYIPTCFVAGTKVYTPNGYKNIEDIKIGDIVYSYNETMNRMELDYIVDTYIHKDDKIYTLYVGKEKIEVTPYHRVYAKTKYDRHGNWVPVNELTEEHFIFTSHKQWQRIRQIGYKVQDSVVYNLEVNNNHTYYVTESNYLVHNAKVPQACI